MSLGRVYFLLVCGIAIISNAYVTVDSYSILCPFPTISQSHFIVVEALLKGLAEAGHNVTVASAFPPKNDIPNYRFVKNAMSEYHADTLKALSEKPGSVMNMFQMIPAVLDFVEHETRSLLRNPEFQEIIKNEKFDLIIYEASLGESLMGLSAHFKCLSVLFSSLAPSNTQLRMTGNPLSISYVSSPIMAIPEPMDFFGRLGNFMYLLFETPILYYWDYRTAIAYASHFRQPNFPTFAEMRKNVSAIFVNDHMSQRGIRPIVPAIIEISGIQVNNEQAYLDNDLRQWMDESKHGVIYFSFGSNMKMSSLDEKIQKEIFEVFAGLKENILIKYEMDMENLPKNVRIGKWLPQIGVLQHTNCKLFVTHAGLGGTTEARYFGVPLITVPIFADQMSNSRRIVQEGWAVEIPFTELNGQTLLIALTEILHNPKYTNRAKYISNLYQDRPLTPLESGIYWIEYIIRHRGAPHMQSNAVHLNFFAYHSLDVIAFLAVTIFVIIVINVKILKCICRMCCCRGANKTKLE